MESNVKDQIVFKQPKRLEEREAAARILVDRLKYRIPVAVDAMDGPAEKVFGAWPERIYLLGQGGRVLYKGEMGPFGFLPEEAEKALANFLARGTLS